MDYTVHGILQARILTWLAIPSRGDLSDPGIKPGSPALQVESLPSEPPRKQRIPEWVAFPSPADLPDPGIKPGSPALQVDSLPIELSGKPLNAKDYINSISLWSTVKKSSRNGN